MTAPRPRYPHAIAGLMQYVSRSGSGKGRDASACWEWTGARSGHGNVPQWRIPDDGRRVNPRAVLLAMKLGRPIVHRAIAGCGNHGCVNPNHAIDATSSPRQRLDPRIVQAVRALTALGWTAPRVAAVLGMPTRTVHAVVFERGRERKETRA